MEKFEGQHNVLVRWVAYLKVLVGWSGFLRSGFER